MAIQGGIRVPPHVLCREVAGEAVLLNLETERYLGLNGIGTRMWIVLSASASIQEALDQLVEEFDVDRARLAEDLDALVEQLLQNGLVVRT